MCCIDSPHVVLPLGVLLVREGVHDDGEQKVENHQKHDGHEGVEKYDGGHQKGPGVDVVGEQRFLRVRELAQQHVDDGLRRLRDILERRDSGPEEDIPHHGVDPDDDDHEQEEVHEILQRAADGAREDADARLEVEELEQAHEEEEEVGPAERDVLSFLMIP